MSKALTQRIDPISAADKGRTFEGSVDLSSLPRLVPMLADEKGEARFWLRFMREGRLPVVQGTVGAELLVQCQCCLKPMALAVDQSFLLGVVESLDAVDTLPDGMEPVLIDGADPGVTVLELVEDELLLALPHVTQHLACESVRPDEQVRLTQARERPAFADLASLVQTKDQ
jgi:uncharacterized protein